MHRGDLAHKLWHQIAVLTFCPKMHQKMREAPPYPVNAKMLERDDVAIFDEMIRIYA